MMRTWDDTRCSVKSNQHSALSIQIRKSKLPKCQESKLKTTAAGSGKVQFGFFGNRGDSRDLVRADC